MIRIVSSRKALQVMALGLLLILLQPPVVSQAKTVDQVEDSSDLAVAGSLVAGQGAEVELGSNTQSEDSNGLVANGCEDLDAGVGKTDEFPQGDDNEVDEVMTGGDGVEKEGGVIMVRSLMSRLRSAPRLTSKTLDGYRQLVQVVLREQRGRISILRGCVSILMA